MKRGIVSRTEDGAFRYQSWPTVARAKNGTLFVGCSGHRLSHFCPFGKNYLYESIDEGATWVGPRIINDSYPEKGESRYPFTAMTRTEYTDFVDRAVKLSVETISQYWKCS